MTQQSESTPISRDIPTWRERLPDTCTYPEMIAAMQSEIDDLLRENESLRARLKAAECILREVRLGKTPEDYGKDSVTIHRLQSCVQNYFDAEREMFGDEPGRYGLTNLGCK